MKFWNAILVCATVCQVGFAAPPLAQNLTKAEVSRMMRNANTPDQYHALAVYFRTQQVRYQQRADAEKAEWQRRQSDQSALAMKYPRPVDSSRNRYEYFIYESKQMGVRAAHFESLATTPR